MSDKLYIIGNGFDLHHCLKTSYYEFAAYLKEHNGEVYDIMEKYISYPTSDRDLWARFEENLANLDADQILSDNTNYLPDYASEEFRDRDIHTYSQVMDEYHQNLTVNLLNQFQEFIKHVKYSEENSKYKIKLDRSALFLTFNYTNTLERLYNINKDQITYIHNSISGTLPIVLGHGIDPETFEDKPILPPSGLSNQQLDQWLDENDTYDYAYDTGKDNLIRYFRDTYKPSQEIMRKHRQWFNNLNAIKEVHVYGHSISSVDIPYFAEIVNNVPIQTLWTVSYYDDNEKVRLLDSLTALGIKGTNISFIELIDIEEMGDQLNLNLNSL